MKIKGFNDIIKYIDRYRNNPKKISKFKERFREYLGLCNKQNIMIFITEILRISEMESILYYNSDVIYRMFGIETILAMTQGMNFEERFKYIYDMYERIRIKYYTVDEFVNDLMANNEVEYICSNMEQIINCSDMKLLVKTDLLGKLKQLDSKMFKEVRSSIVCKMTGIKPKFMDSAILYALTLIIDEISENENIDISELEYIGTGTFTNVYKLGNKVIKFGKNRLTDKIPYHRRILQPLIRRKISSDFRNLYIEISEYIQPDNSITDEDAYLIYKELRDDGIIWLDAKKENLGRLEKDNIAYFSEPLYVKNETVGYITETLKQDKPLQKGELVIIDTDFLFREKDFDLTLLNSRINLDFYLSCEQRYQKEKRAKKNNEIISKSLER